MKDFKALYPRIGLIGILLSVILACNTKVTEKESKTENTVNAVNTELTESIPESVIQFLITSAAKDFNEHQPPVVIDIRNVRAGYSASENEKTYLICGEFLAEKNKDWEQFTTIKTSDYEQYIGETTYCQKATFVQTDSNMLSEEIKSKLNTLKK